MTFCLCLEWWGQAGSSHYHVHAVLPRMQCVWWGGRWGVWHGQQHWKRQQLWLFEPNTESQVKVSHGNIWELNENTWREFSSCFISEAYFSQPTWTWCPPNHLTVSAFLPAISREEQFEDYGEGEDVDFTPSSPCPEEDTRTNGFSDLGSSLPSRLVAGQDDHF